jgi:hypothetical protein
MGDGLWVTATSRDRPSEEPFSQIDVQPLAERRRSPGLYLRLDGRRIAPNGLAPSAASTGMNEPESSYGQDHGGS